MRKKSSKIVANRHCEEQAYLPSQKQSTCKQWPWHQGTQTWSWMWHNLLACSAGHKPLQPQLLKILNEENE